MKLITALLAASVASSQAETDFSAIRAKGIYGTLLDTLEFTDLDAVISENAPVTIIGPSDQAFGEVAGIIAYLSTAEISQIVLNHIIPNATITSEVLRKEGCMVVKTIGGLEVSMFRDPIDGRMDVDNDLIVDPDVVFQDGVLHGIEDVIIADAHEFLGCPSFADLSAISDNANFSTLLGVIEDSHNHFTITMNVENTTIFGPTNAAFAAVQDAVDELNENELDTLVRSHMAIGEIKSEEVIAFGCTEMNTIAGGKLAIRFDQTSETASVNGVPISSTEFDIVGEYFVLHGIEGVLLPGQSEFVPCTQDILDFSPVAETGNYGTLLDLVVKTGLDTTIGMNRPTTILAPTDAAFAKIQGIVAGLNDTELATGLANHVIANLTIHSSEVVAEECIDAETIGGLPVNINFDILTGKTTVNGIPVVESDIRGNYGILMGLDGVLGIDGEYSPCSPYSEVETLSEFYEIDINAAAYDEPTTTFGPRNDAIFSHDMYPFEGGQSRQKEIDFILGHIVPGNYTVEQVKAAGCLVLETLAGTKLRVMWLEHGNDHNPSHGTAARNRRRLTNHMGSGKRGVVMVNDAKVILADQLPNEKNENVFHGIDKVLLPGSFNECPRPTMAPVVAPIGEATPPPGGATPPPAPTAPTASPPKSSVSAFGLSVTFASVIASIAI